MTAIIGVLSARSSASERFPSRQSPCQKETAQFRDRLHRDCDGMGERVAREDVLAEAACRIPPERRNVLHREEIVAKGGCGRRRTARIARRADAAGRELQMMDLRSRLETDAAACRDHPPGEGAFEAIGGVEEAFVEGADA